MQFRKSDGILPSVPVETGAEMGIFDMVCDVVEGAGRAIDTAVNLVIIDGVGGALDTVIDVVKDNPGKAAAIAVGTVVSGGTALVFAGPIATTLGSAGLLGTASTGTAITSLGGAALTNASLAAIGGGSIAAGGGGIVAGTAVVAATGATAGAVVSGGAAAAMGDRA